MALRWEERVRAAERVRFEATFSADRPNARPLRPGRVSVAAPEGALALRRLGARPTTIQAACLRRRGRMACGRSRHIRGARCGFRTARLTEERTERRRSGTPTGRRRRSARASAPVGREPAGRTRPARGERDARSAAHESSLTQRAGPASRNSVRLGSSPRAPTRVGGLRASAGVLAAGPVQPVYSSSEGSAKAGVRLAAAALGFALRPHGSRVGTSSAGIAQSIGLERDDHCLTGCAIGEVLGMVIATALGGGMWPPSRSRSSSPSSSATR